jgi:hypothetical protein
MAPQLVVIHFLSNHPGEGRDPFLPWAPAFAGVVEKAGGTLEGHR